MHIRTVGYKIITMIRIALCDDEQQYLDIEKRYIEEYLTEKNIEHETRCFLSGVSFLQSMKEEQDYDLVLLDVEMQADNGIDVAKSIIEINPKIRVAFVSAHANYATFGYHVKAIRFILKNKKLETYIHECLDYVLMEIDNDNRKITLELVSGMKEFYVDNILYLIADKHYVQIKLTDSSDKSIYRLRGSLKEISEEMRSYGFVSLNYHVSVNLKHIVSINEQKAEIDNGDFIEISQRKYVEANRTFILYKGKKK